MFGVRDGEPVYVSDERRTCGVSAMKLVLYA
jgi:hypothetical protein